MCVSMSDIEGHGHVNECRKKYILTIDGQDGIKAKEKMNREVASRGWVYRKGRIH